MNLLKKKFGEKRKKNYVDIMCKFLINFFILLIRFVFVMKLGKGICVLFEKYM